MPTMAHFGPDWVDRPWWSTFGWVMPLLVILFLGGVTVWAVVRLTSDRRPVAIGPTPPMAIGPPTPVAPSQDAALERARMRYADGEMSRDEFVRLSRDLGAPIQTQEADDA
ncbi:MAG TPA: hypothetical protein VFT27_09510 [Actinomycetota bacterium]|nr:hypothetical protein [Actinomycetota bacterium]